MEAMLRRSGRCRAVKGVHMIKYMGTKKTDEGSVLYIFLINGLQKEIRESALKQYPGCYEALPATAKARISANRAWLSKI
jgi:hypothetical protein